MLTFFAVHTSGLFSASTIKWREDIAELIEDYSPTIISGTESRGRETAFAQPYFAQRHAGDCIFGWHVEEWALVHSEKAPMAPAKKYFKPVASPLVVLEHRTTGKRLLGGCVHMPIRRPGARDWVRGRVKYAAGLRNLKKRSRRLQKKYKVDLVYIPGDYNENLTKRSVRLFIKSFVGHWRVSVPKGYKGRGTGPSGIAVIDGALVSKFVKVRQFRVLRKIRSSDHSPFLHVLSLMPKKAIAREGHDELPD